MRKSGHFSVSTAGIGTGTEFAGNMRLKLSVVRHENSNAGGLINPGGRSPLSS